MIRTVASKVMWVGRATVFLVPRGCKGGDAGSLTSFSANDECISITFSEATQSLSNGLHGDSNGGVPRNFTGDSRASSLTCLPTLASTASSR
jgi:hypothetical protein